VQGAEPNGLAPEDESGCELVSELIMTDARSTASRAEEPAAGSTLGAAAPTAGDRRCDETRLDEPCPRLSIRLQTKTGAVEHEALFKGRLFAE